VIYDGENIMEIKSSNINELNEQGEFKYNKVIQYMGSNKWIFERNENNIGWLQKDKATKEDEQFYPVVIDD